MIYLDNAATSWPKPPAVHATLGTFLQTLGANPGRAGHQMAVGAAAAIADTRLHLARLIGADSPERVIFTASATESLNLAILGLLHPGDHAVTTTMEHNSVVRPLAVMTGRGVAVTKVPAASNGLIDPAMIAAAVSSRTRLIVATHASNVNGAVQPIAALAEIAHAIGAWLLVDGSQTVGSMPVDVEADGIDLLAFPGHKGLLGPPGTGALVLGTRVDPSELEPTRSGGTGLRSEDDAQPLTLPFRYESGTANTVGIAALGAALTFVQEIGVAAIQDHESALTTSLFAGLDAIPGVRVIPSSDPGPRAAVVSFLIDGWEPSDVGAILDQSFGIACRTGLHCAPDACRTLGVFPAGTVRFSPGWFTTSKEIDAAVAAVGEIATSPLR